MKTSHILLLTSLVTVAVIVVGVLAWQPWRDIGGTATSDNSGVEIGGPFTLVDQDGNEATEAVLDRELNVIYFGYTYCPDVCPTTLQDIASAMDLIGR